MQYPAVDSRGRKSAELRYSAAFKLVFHVKLKVNKMEDTRRGRSRGGVEEWATLEHREDRRRQAVASAAPFDGALGTNVRFSSALEAESTQEGGGLLLAGASYT